MRRTLRKNTALVKGLKLQTKDIETNLGAFRVYVQTLLQQHPYINQNLSLVVSLQGPTPSGIPLNLHVFASETGTVIYEKIQAEIFEKLISVIPVFGLRIFQDPSWYDYHKHDSAPVYKQK